jgi:hypothetical protein
VTDNELFVRGGMAHCNSGQAATRIGISCPAQDTIDFRGSVQIPVRRHERPVIATVAAAPPIDRERAATASHFSGAPYNSSICEAPRQLPAARLGCGTGDGRRPFAKSLPTSPHHTPDYSGLPSCRFFVEKSAPSPRKCYLGRKRDCTKIGFSSSGDAHSTTQRARMLASRETVSVPERMPAARRDPVPKSGSFRGVLANGSRRH